jgi:hypothetical protein
MSSDTKTKPAKLETLYARVTAERDEWQKKINDAHRRFVDAANESPETAGGAWAAYRKAVHNAQNALPETMPAPEGPPMPSSGWLDQEYEHLTGWAPHIAAGTVEATVSGGSGVRRLDPEEREDFQKRAAAYHENVARHQQLLEDYVIWHRVMTHDERVEHGGSGGYASKIDDYAERAKAWSNATGQQAVPGPCAANQYGFARPYPVPRVPNPYSSGRPTLQMPVPVESFDAALSAALDAA